MNEDKQCRAPLITVDENGFCTVKNEGPHENKSDIERHVEIRECKCKECDSWEEDFDTDLGRCGLEDRLSFTGRPKDTNEEDQHEAEMRKESKAISEAPNADEMSKIRGGALRKLLTEGSPKCLDFENQVGQPQWATTLD
jgi:hypothetical protein